MLGLQDSCLVWATAENVTRVRRGSGDGSLTTRDGYGVGRA